MKKILIALISFTSLSMSAQTSSVEYSYDNAGNRIQRTVIIVGGMAQQEGTEQATILEERVSLENEGEVLFSLHPNPTAADVAIQVSYRNVEQQVLNYLLYDMSGKVLEQKQSSDLSHTMSLQQQAPGIYFIRILSTENELLKEIKVVKK
jgi:uncharacterized protein RhaS with RHS repeats